MNNSLFSLKGKTILLTGAFGLFGRELVDAFYNAGANIMACGHRQPKIDAWQRENAARFSPDRFRVQALELTDCDSIELAVSTCVDAFGSLDVLVNNASVDAKFDDTNRHQIDASAFENFPMKKLRTSVDINMLGTISVTQAACRQMLKQGYGNIINVGSVYSVIAPNPSLYAQSGKPASFKPVDYVASKSFIPNFTRYLAANYAGRKIRCNAIAPHGVYDGHADDFMQSFARLSPEGRMCEIHELDGPFVFLASDASSYLNGITIVYDGGWTAW